MFIWKRFPVIAAIIMEEVILPEGSKGMRSSNSYKPSAWRWLNSKQVSIKYLAYVIDNEEVFCFRPYSYNPPGIMKSMLF